MGIISKHIINNLKERKLRTLVMLFSVMLATLLLFVSLCIGDSYVAAQKKMAKGVAGTATLAITRQDGMWISESEVPQLDTIKQCLGMIKVGALFTEAGYFETIDVIGAALEGLDQMNPPRYIEGEIGMQFEGNQIVLPEKFTRKYGLTIGDQITLQIGGESYVFSLQAIAAYDTIFLRHTRGFNALIPKTTLQNILGVGEDGFTQIMIEPKQSDYTELLKSELIQTMGDGYQVATVVNEATIKQQATSKSMPFFLIAFFALTMSVFIIYSSYKMIILERLTAIGTLRSIGATKKRVLAILLLESCLYGILGSLLGIAVGVVVLRIMLIGLSEGLQEGINIPVVIQPLNIMISLFVGVIVSMLSAYLPVTKASKLPLKEVILGKVTQKEMTYTGRMIIGVSLLVLSLILPHFGKDKMLYILGGLALLGFIVSAIMLIPVLTKVASRLLVPIYGKCFGNEGVLAVRALRGNKNTNQNVTLLFISLSAVIAISTVGSFVNSYIGDVFSDAALDGFADGVMNKSFVEQVEQIETIEEVLPIYVIKGVSQNNMAFSRMEAAPELAKYKEMFGVSYDQLIMDEAIVEASFSEGRYALLSAESLTERAIQIGNEISLQRGSETFTYKVLGSFKSRAISTDLIIPEVYAIEDFKVEQYGILAYRATNPDAVILQIRNFFGNTPNWSRSVKEFNEDALGTVSAFLKPMNQMTYLILLLAIIGVINNLLINYMEKQREIAMYISVGMSQE